MYADKLLHPRFKTHHPQQHVGSLTIPLAEYVQKLAISKDHPPEIVAADLIADNAGRRNYASNSYHRWCKLTSREKEIAALVCLGMTNHQIGSVLVISNETVKSHVKRLLAKYKLHKKDELRILLVDWDFTAWGHRK